MSDRGLLPGLDVSRETYSRLKDYEKLLFKWNSRINLVSKSTLSDFWGRHILDSAQFFHYLVKKLENGLILGVVVVFRDWLLQFYQMSLVYQIGSL